MKEEKNIIMKREKKVSKKLQEFINSIAIIGNSTIPDDGRAGIWVRYTYNDKVPNELMREQISGIFSEYPEKWGKGEWVATTIEDAKQMAIDFARNIS